MKRSKSQCQLSCAWRARTWKKGRQILAESGLNFRIADGMADAAHKVVQAIQG